MKLKGSSGKMDIKTQNHISVDAFIRTIAVNKNRPLCLILGAGASISSGMPSAQRCIWEWKRDIFVTNNPTLRDAVGELSLPGTKQRIQKWLDQRGQYPKADSPEEYSFYAAACYPTGRDRRSFFQSYIAESKPHTGYSLLALLAKAGCIRTVWTTNFDSLVARACAASNVVCVEVGIDTQQRAMRAHSQGELRQVSLHGDYRYDDLKNTEQELQQQESELKSELLHELADHDLAVIGYSGRDPSLMQALTDAYSRKGESRLFWCGYGEDVPEPVSTLLNNADSAGRHCFYIPTEGFDDLMSRLALRQLDGQILEAAKEILKSAPIATQKQAAFSTSNLEMTSLVKSNAYQLSHPLNALKIDIDIPTDTDKRKWIGERMPREVGSCVNFGNGFLSLATADQIHMSFGQSLRGSPISVAISPEDINRDTRIKSLLCHALVSAAAKKFELETDHNRRIWETIAYQDRSHDGQKYRIYRALSFRIIELLGKPHVVLTPEIIAKDRNLEIADKDVGKILRNAIYGYQHNNVFDSDLKHWTKKISEIDIPISTGDSFRITKAPVYAGLTQKGFRPLPDAMQKHARQSGIVVPDAPLIFSTLDGRNETSDPNPLKGLIGNRPWDFQLTSLGISPRIDVSVICPRQDAGKLKKFLGQLQERARPEDQERDYLHDFPGFATAFGLPLQYAEPGHPSWIEIGENFPGAPMDAAKSLAQSICRAIDVIRAQTPGSIVTIFVPTRWSQLKIVSTESESFNLHDYVKAYAARQGQSTQFIREETTLSSQPCRVRWWLSLALYVKALRTPWRLDCIDDDTAFVGIGYSLEKANSANGHVLLGCSHLYSARGEGLQFRLGRIDNPIIRGRNPFMSEDDARRTGETIRQLFFDARMRLPKRVVIHKRTHFTQEEQKGLIQGLDGVANIELIEINVEDQLRYLASKLSEGKLVIDGFPLPRGSTVIQDSNTALLWVHGSAPSAKNPKFKYYQGKRRIPAPLLIRRYMGQSDITQVATEILGLSKMNWNTFDYYSRLPATLDSASAIAKVGSYLSGFSSAPYDYRLLI